MFTALVKSPKVATAQAHQLMDEGNMVYIYRGMLLSNTDLQADATRE